MVTIRLTRTGRKKVAKYRVVVADSRKRRDGRFIERLGDYNPMTQPATFNINHERALYWLGQGAQMSDTVHTLFHRDGVIKKLQLAKKNLDASGIQVERKQEKKKKVVRSKKAVARETAAAEEAKKAAEEPKKEEEAPKAEETPASEAEKEAPAEA